MFQSPIFREERTNVMHKMMHDYPFATLVSASESSLSADHIPLVLHPELSKIGTIRGHISIANPLWRNGEEEAQVLAIFQGPQAYISPSWYPTKQEHGKVVPTWNYVVVHAHGMLRFIKDHDWLLEHLGELTKRNENHRADPWAVSDAPDEFVARQLKGIVGIEIEVKSLSGTWKLSQNKNHQDKEGVEQGLADENTEQAIAVSNLVRDAAK